MSSANFCESLQSDEAGLRCAEMSERPVFHAELGARLRRYREAKKWSLEHAVQRAKDKGFSSMTAQKLRYLEDGMTKHPDADVLAAISAIYRIDYASLVGHFVRRNYGLSPDPRAARSLPLDREIDPAVLMALSDPSVEIEIASFLRLPDAARAWVLQSRAVFGGQPPAEPIGEPARAPQAKANTKEGPGRRR